jgi:DNA-directed RNA polymerase subunit RPC12/RpoP
MPNHARILGCRNWPFEKGESSMRMEDNDCVHQEEYICERCGNEVDEESWDCSWKLCPWCAHQVAKDEIDAYRRHRRSA